MCSIFGIKINKNDLIVGRNFDWSQLGGKIHFIPPYSSYGIMTYGICLIEQIGIDRPYEGINEKGLFVGMAAVENSQIHKSKFIYMNNLGLIKFILERAGTVEEALSIAKKFKLYYMQDEGYPKVHYFFADVEGNVAIYEEDEYESKDQLNEGEWKAITNFSLNNVLPCARFEKISEDLSDKKVVDLRSAAELLSQVKQDSTVYSSVYNLSRRELVVYVERDFNNGYSFNLAEELKKGNHCIDFGSLKIRYFSGAD